MLWIECRGGDGHRAPKVLLGIDRFSGDFAHDAQVVDRICQIGMKWAEAGLLRASGIAEQRFGSAVVASPRCFLRGFDQDARFGRFPHDVLTAGSKIDAYQESERGFRSRALPQNVDSAQFSAAA
jgi:hypothetical protein